MIQISQQDIRLYCKQFVEEIEGRDKLCFVAALTCPFRILLNSIVQVFAGTTLTLLGQQLILLRSSMARGCDAFLSTVIARQFATIAHLSILYNRAHTLSRSL